MKLLYTASWTDDNAVAAVMATFTSWIAAQAAHNPFLEAHHQFSRADDDKYSASMVESDGGNGSRQTRLWAVQTRRDCGTVSTTITVEVQGETRSCTAPAIVSSLIEAGLRPCVGHDLLTTTPRYVTGAAGGEQLAEDVSAFDRRVPIVVMTHIPELFDRLRRSPSEFDTIAAGTAAAAAGVANVVVADPDAAVGFNDALGPDHAVRPGYLRIFRPGVDPAIEGEHGNHPWLAPGRWYADEYLAPRYVARRTTAPQTTQPRRRRVLAVV